jgi:hypothetical protein
MKGQQKHCLACMTRAMRRLPSDYGVNPCVNGSLSDVAGVIPSLLTRLTALRCASYTKKFCKREVCHCHCAFSECCGNELSSVDALHKIK